MLKAIIEIVKKQCFTFIIIIISVKSYYIQRTFNIYLFSTFKLNIIILTKIHIENCYTYLFYHFQVFSYLLFFCIQYNILNIFAVNKPNILITTFKRNIIILTKMHTQKMLHLLILSFSSFCFTCPFITYIITFSHI